MTTSQSPDVFLRHLTRCRRRLQWLLFLRQASAAISISIVAAAGFIVLSRAEGADAIAWFGTAVVLGFATATVVARWRGPDLRSTARALDVELHLEDRIATALQFLAGDDPISRLIVRDAAARVSHIVPAQVFRLDVRVVRRLLLMPVSAVLLAGSLVTFHGAGGAERANRGRGEGQAAEARAAGSARVDSTSRASEAREGMPPTSPAPSAEAAPSEKATAVDRAMAPQTEDPTRPQDIDAQTASTNRTRQLAYSDVAEGTAAERKPAGGGPDAAQSHGRGEGASGAGRGIAGGVVQASRTGAGSDGAEAPTELHARGSGGLRGSLGATATAAPYRIGSAEASYPARYRAVWARVQASLARHDVPAAFRTYLTDYFVAIRPADRE